MNMKGKARLLLGMAMAMGGGFKQGSRQPEFLTPEERKRQREKNEEKINKARGLTRFHYGDGRFIYARDQKNADRKAKNKGWLLKSFKEQEPEIGAYVSLVWKDGSDCECTYNGLDKTILPLPTHWYYVTKNQKS
jgi:hypothetical protein